MDPVTILALADAGISMYERVLEMLEEARKSGVITPEEQAERLQRVDKLKARLGL